MNTKTSASQSAFFNPRVLLAFALCSCGVLLGMFSLAATPLSELESSPSRKPGEAPRANITLPADPRNFPSTVGTNADRLPPGVPLPLGAQFSPNNRQGDPSSSSPAAGFPGFKGMPLRPGSASDANSLGNPVLANQQPAPLSVQRPTASESMPLASAAQIDWSIVNSSNATTDGPNVLKSVTCVSASDCWAVGAHSGTTYQILIERWDGISWAIVAPPKPGATQSGDAILYGVTCVSASNCWAVGNSYNASDWDHTLVERWDGTSWTIVTSPNTTATVHNRLFGVTCVSASECWAVGEHSTDTAYETLIERWDGTSWA